MTPESQGVLPSVVALGLVAAVAVGLAWARTWSGSASASRGGAVRLAAVTVLAQAAHFAEELATGFASRFPALFGLTPIPLRLFVTFNLLCLAIWGLAVPGIARRCRWALLPLWFLALAAALNGLAHPVMAWRAGGYFPGLGSALVVGVLGLLLLGRLRTLTVPVP